MVLYTVELFMRGYTCRGLVRKKLFDLMNRLMHVVMAVSPALGLNISYCYSLDGFCVTGRTVVKNISKNLGKERLLFMADRNLDNLLNSMKSLGEFGEDTHVYKAQFEGEFNFSLSSGKFVSRCYSSGRNTHLYDSLSERLASISVCHIVNLVYSCLKILPHSLGRGHEVKWSPGVFGRKYTL